jgi:cyclase
VIPVLLLWRGGLYKTVRFAAPTYVGDPVNVSKIFNDKGVDELILLDIGQARTRTPLALDMIEAVAEECFMPLCYGGGVRSLSDMQALYALGVEKIALNTAAVETPDLVKHAAREFGSQSVVVSIDVKQSSGGPLTVHTHGGLRDTGLDPVGHAKQVEELGAGEIMVTSIDREGTRAGIDIALTKAVSDAVHIPIIAHGGAGTAAHAVEAIDAGGASAIAAGSLFVLVEPYRAVLPTYAGIDDLRRTAARTD